MKYLFAVTSVFLLTLAFTGGVQASTAAEKKSAGNQAVITQAEAQDRSTRETQTPKRTRLKPARLIAKKPKLYLSAAGAKAPRYVCDSVEGECTCSGIADCIALKDSGDCT